MAHSLDEIGDSDVYSAEAISPTLHLGGIHVLRTTWLGPAWSAFCGMIASSAIDLGGLSLLVGGLSLVVADWAWPALWTTCVRTNWRAPLARWREVPSLDAGLSPQLRPGSPGVRYLNALRRAGLWWRSFGSSMVGASVSSGWVALVVAVLVSATIGWRALALTLAVVALTGLGTLRALHSATDSNTLRAVVYGVLPWWLGHAAFTSLTLESAGIGLLFGWTYRVLMESGDHKPVPAGLFLSQVGVAVVLFAGSQFVPAFVVGLAIAAQASLRSFLVAHSFARRAQAWLMLAMLVCALAIA